MERELVEKVLKVIPSTKKRDRLLFRSSPWVTEISGKKGSHRKVHVRYNRFEHLGNVDPAHRDTFSKLAQLRPRARYIEGDVSVAQADTRCHQETVRDMIDGARDWAS